MSDMNANQTGTTDAGSLSSEPPVISPTTGRNTLLPTTKLQPRKVTGVAPDVQITDQTVFTQQGYVGQNLVDRTGVISRGQYSDDEAYNELAKLPPSNRRLVLKKLEALGIYGRSKPSATGLAGRDLSAMAEALRTANAYGVTVDVALSLMAADPNIRQTVPTRSVRTTAKQDLRQVFKQAAGSILGRQLSDSEVDKFVRSYQGMEVTEGMGGATAPSAAVAAQEAVTAAAPEEAAAMGALRLAELMDRRIKELA